MIPRLREIKLFRFAYAGVVVARILFGYKLLSLRRKRLPEDVYLQRLGERHLRSAGTYRPPRISPPRFPTLASLCLRAWLLPRFSGIPTRWSPQFVIS